ncbi:MAG: hypothetical protein V4471_01655 [Pseudomonadota bacterium]
MGAIASAVVATLSRNRHANSAWFDKKQTAHKYKTVLNSHWLKEHSPSILPHVNEPLLQTICAQIKNTLGKKINNPEVKKSYRTLLHTLSCYQTEAETILMHKENLKSRALFLISALAAPLFICLCISLFLPTMLPITILSLLFFVGFVGTPSYSAYKLRKKHPAYEMKLNYHFKNFAYTLEKCIDNSVESLNSQNNTSSKIPLLNINKTEECSKPLNLKSNTLLFKLNSLTEEPNVNAMKKEKAVIKPPRLL